MNALRARVSPDRGPPGLLTILRTASLLKGEGYFARIAHERARCARSGRGGPGGPRFGLICALIVLAWTTHAFAQPANFDDKPTGFLTVRTGGMPADAWNGTSLATAK